MFPKNLRNIYYKDCTLEANLEKNKFF